jgi:hypothetical protein
MSSGSLAGGIGVWGASLRPVGFGWQAGIMAAPELWALLLSLRGWRAGLASGDTRPSARGCPRWVALLRGDFCSSLFGVGGGVGVWGHPAFGPRVSPVGCVAAWGFLLLALWGGGGVGVPVGGVAAWGISFPPSFFPSFLRNR